MGCLVAGSGLGYGNTSVTAAVFSLFVLIQIYNKTCKMQHLLQICIEILQPKLRSIWPQQMLQYFAENLEQMQHFALIINGIAPYHLSPANSPPFCPLSHLIA